MLFDGPPKHKEVIEIGDSVLCDLCNGDYTESDETGGFIFGSNAVCPACSPRVMEGIKKYNEEDYIHAKAEEGEKFGDFVRNYRRTRGGGDQIIIESW